MTMGICSMCEDAPATTTWGLPVCQPCADWLAELQVELTEMEADDPKLADAGRRVEEAGREFMEAHRTDQPEPDQ